MDISSRRGGRTSLNDAEPPPLPAFLAVPLSDKDPSVLQVIHRTLSEREHDRMFMAAGARAKQSTSLDGQAGEISAAGKEPYSMTVGTHPTHVKKNRYTDIVCYDRSRVLLSDGEAEEGEYVNATLLQEPDLGFDVEAVPRRWWLAAQAPIASTLHAFLSLLLTPPRSASSKGSPPLPLVEVIVQLTALRERRSDKCHVYFPPTIGETWHIPPRGGDRGIWIRLDDKEKVPTEVRRVSKLTVGWEGDEGRPITHVEYLEWGDHGVPKAPDDLLDFIAWINALNGTNNKANPPPILVHCSAGVGRSGTYITIASLLPVLSHLRASPLPMLSPPSHSQHRPPMITPPLASSTSAELAPYPSSSFSHKLPRDYVGETVDALREHRCMMVQTPSQLVFCYQALAVAWTRI